MKTIEWTSPISAQNLLREAQEQEVVVVRDGHPVALVVPFDEEDLRWYARERDPDFIRSIAAARKDIADGKSVGHDQLIKELGL